MTASMAATSLVLLVASLQIITGCAGRPFYPLPSKKEDGNRQPIQTAGPYNIAHRGSNGEIPEETAAAYMRAIQEGADFIETDILATKDGALICFHDVTLDDTTDVHKHKEFSNRRKTYEVQGSNVTGWFVVDFTLEELKTLRVKQRYIFRDQSYNWEFSIITFEDFISIALDAPRVVGIYPEIKNPVHINEHTYWEITSDSYLDYIKDYVVGIGPWKDTIVPADKLNYLTTPTDLVAKAHAHNLQTYWEITSDSYLDYIKDYVVGIGPWKDTIVPADKLNYLTTPTDLVAKAHAHNLQVKWPGGKRFEDKFVETLLKYGYKGEYMSTDWLKQPVFIQSFAPTSLIYVSNLTASPKIFLIDDVTVPTQDTNQTYWEITSDSYLDYIKDYVVGIGPWKDTIVPADKLNYLTTPTDLVAKAHAHNLQVHPYTFRNENTFLHFNFHQDPYAEYAYWLKVIGVDGLFTDFTGSLHTYQEWTSPTDSEKNGTALDLLHKIAGMIKSFRKT